MASLRTSAEKFFGKLTTHYYFWELHTHRPPPPSYFQVSEKKMHHIYAIQVIR